MLLQSVNELIIVSRIIIYLWTWRSDLCYIDSLKSQNKSPSQIFVREWVWGYVQLTWTQLGRRISTLGTPMLLDVVRWAPTPTAQCVGLIAAFSKTRSSLRLKEKHNIPITRGESQKWFFTLKSNYFNNYFYQQLFTVTWSIN